MTRKTHTLLFALSLTGVVVLFGLLVAREILVGIGYDAAAVDPVMTAVFATISLPTFACLMVFAAPKFFADMFLNDTYPRPRIFGPRKQESVDRAKETLGSLGLLLEDDPDEKNVATSRGEHDAVPHKSIKPRKAE